MEEGGMEERKEERGERGREDRGQDSVGILSPHTIPSVCNAQTKRGSRAARLGRELVGSTYVYISL